MQPRERVLELACLCIKRGRALPVDLLQEADALGIDLSVLDQPKPKTEEQTNKEFVQWHQTIEHHE